MFAPKIIRFYALAAISLSIAFLSMSQAKATVIDFENVADLNLTQNQSIVSNGYTVTEGDGNNAFMLISGNSGQAATSFVGNGTKRLIAFNNSDITIASIGNTPFNLYAFDGGESWVSQPHYWATQISATGTTVEGTQTTQVFDLDIIKNPITGMQNFTFNNSFQNLTSVVFRGIGGNPEFSIDNISVAAVPEPATVALLGLGLLGVAASRRKSAKNKNT